MPATYWFPAKRVSTRINSDDTIECKHGETECLGNMLSLCAEDLFPNNTVIFLGFTTCLVTSYPRIPHRDLVENCALEHGIEFDALNACVSEDGKGLELLRESIERSKDAAVTRSCTVRVAGKKWCVRVRVSEVFTSFPRSLIEYRDI